MQRCVSRYRRWPFLLAPLREGRLSTSACNARTSGISTRAPTRGSTYQNALNSNATTQFLLAPLQEGRPEAGLAPAPRWVFLLALLQEGRQQFFTKPQVDLYDKLLKIHIFQINTFCILQYSFENFKDYFVGSARTSRKNVYGKGWR